MTITIHNKQTVGLMLVTIAEANAVEPKDSSKKPYLELKYRILQAPDPELVGEVIPFQKFYYTTKMGRDQACRLIQAATGQVMPEDTFEFNEKDLENYEVTVRIVKDEYGLKTKEVWPADDYDNQVAKESLPF